MSKELVISATPHETRVAIVEDGQLCEIYIEREKEFALVGSLYKGRVTRVLPGMQSAFVDIGLDSDAFLYVSDFLEHLEEYDHVAALEPKVQKPQPRDAEVFAPSTTTGGAHEPAPVEIPSSDDAAPIFSAGPEGLTAHTPAIVPLEGETIHAAGAGSSAVPENSAVAATPAQHNQRPFEQRHDRGNDRGNNRGNDRGPRGNDRGRGGFGDRGGRGGRNRRWGRPGQGGGNRDRGPRRDLPPSKYASPKPFDSKPHESAPYEPAPMDPNFEPIILPGESLAKYKNRSAAPPFEPSQAGTVETPHAHPNVESAREQFDTRLPDSLYATPASAVSPDEQPAVVEASAAVIEEIVAVPQFEAPPVTPEPVVMAYQKPEAAEAVAEAALELESAAEAHPSNGLSLSEEQVAALAEQLAEAKHEEAQAEAEARSEAMESAAEPFVEAAELEDLQEALDTEHEGEPSESESESEEDAAEDEADEADALADEMHDEAMAAEGSLEHSGEVAEVHEGENVEGQEGQPVSGSVQAAENQQPTSARISNQPRARFQRPMRRGGRPQRGGGGRRGGRPNDNRPHQHTQHGHPKHEAHKRPQLISEMLKAGEEIIVQIAKEPLGKKGARITSHVALPGRFLVYMPTVDHIGVSRRIGSAEDRSRLRRVVTEAKGTFPGGFIVRTAASEASDDEIRADVEFLGRTWDTIRATSEQRRAPSILHRDLNLVERILRDYLSDDYVAIWIDNEEEFTKVVEFVGRFQPKMVPRVKLYTKEAPIFEEFGIQQELDKALRPKVWLKSGGYVVINHTEALVAIDVNTGKYVGRGSTRLEDTIVKTNLEAVKEIVRQIRLRDLGGIIVCDFIDMEERRNRDKVMAALDQALSADRAPSKALSFNEFGLVCITRKRTKQALERVLCQPCPYCTGSGMVKSIPTICYEIQSEARKMSTDMDARSLTLRVNPEIAKALKTRESSLIDELEQITKKSIIIQSDPTLHWEQYDIY
jgi:ribonuclease G